MASKFASTLEDVRKAATRSGSQRFTPTFKWEAGETKYLQFFVDFEDEEDSGVRTVLMHRFIITGYREDGSEMYADFISRRDPNLDGPQGYDPIVDRFGIQPSKRTIVVAAELEPVWSDGPRKKIVDWDVATRQFKKDEETVEVPNIALVIESPHTFYAQMLNLVDMGEDFQGIYAVLRSGKSTDTTYTFKCVAEALDLDEEIDAFEEEFDIDAWLDDLASEDRIKELIDPLDDDAIISKYPGKGKKGGKAEKEESKTPARSTRTRRSRSAAPVAEETEAEPEEPNDAPEAEAADVPEPEAEAPSDEQPTTRRRSRKFSELKRDTKR